MSGTNPFEGLESPTKPLAANAKEEEQAGTVEQQSSSPQQDAAPPAEEAGAVQGGDEDGSAPDGAAAAAADPMQMLQRIIEAARNKEAQYRDRASSATAQLREISQEEQLLLQRRADEERQRAEMEKKLAYQQKLKLEAARKAAEDSKAREAEENELRERVLSQERTAAQQQVLEEEARKAEAAAALSSAQADRANAANAVLETELEEKRLERDLELSQKEKEMQQQLKEEAEREREAQAQEDAAAAAAAKEPAAAPAGAAATASSTSVAGVADDDVSHTGDWSADVAQLSSELAAKDVSEWSVQDVTSWLESMNYAAYCPAFFKLSVDGELLLQLSEEDLRSELGVNSAVACKKILSELTRIRENASTNDSAADVGTWNVGRVVRWLRSMNLDQHTDTFRHHSVDGPTLLMLTDKELKDELNISSGIVRKRVLNTINKMKQVSTMSPAKRGLVPSLNLGGSGDSDEDGSSISTIASEDIDGQKDKAKDKKAEDGESSYEYESDDDDGAAAAAVQAAKEDEDEEEEEEAMPPVRPMLTPRTPRGMRMTPGGTLQLSPRSLEYLETRRAEMAARVQEANAQEGGEGAGQDGQQQHHDGSVGVGLGVDDDDASSNMDSVSVVAAQNAQREKEQLEQQQQQQQQQQQGSSTASVLAAADEQLDRNKKIGNVEREGHLPQTPGGEGNENVHPNPNNESVMSGSSVGNNNTSMMSLPYEPCAVCGAYPADYMCGQCNQVSYCGAKCQEQHWPKHYVECVTFVKKRYLRMVNAAVKIQALARGVRTRQRCAKMLAAHRKRQRYQRILKKLKLGPGRAGQEQVLDTAVVCKEHTATHTRLRDIVALQERPAKATGSSSGVPGVCRLKFKVRERRTQVAGLHAETRKEQGESALIQLDSSVGGGESSPRSSVTGITVSSIGLGMSKHDPTSSSSKPRNDAEPADGTLMAAMRGLGDMYLGSFADDRVSPEVEFGYVLSHDMLHDHLGIEELRVLVQLMRDLTDVHSEYLVSILTEKDQLKIEEEELNLTIKQLQRKNQEPQFAANVASPVAPVVPFAAMAGSPATTQSQMATPSTASNFSTPGRFSDVSYGTPTSTDGKEKKKSKNRFVRYLQKRREKKKNKALQKEAMKYMLKQQAEAQAQHYQYQLQLQQQQHQQQLEIQTRGARRGTIA